ncbi:alpha/beta hydrolase [Paramagnetospirillum kuznetsovii]|uniref:Alpha/beta hydrolase n=1 Tax=Paramagnetospirillum kuznetsovii TaxID=2053833 RepID=A0A364NX74_9PROT|nr:alpha/beta hydrolase [Paramagnetospirillum kuznetsovii]RAU21580.1 alpha/beta hydrolase [Paramagnetospirillum kuznetsovii]
MIASQTVSRGTPGKLDDDVAFILAKAAELKLPSLGTMSPVDARAEFARRLSRTNPPAPDGVDAETMAIPGPGGALPIRLFRPAGQAEVKAALLYFHGGGFVVGDLDTHDAICRNIALRTGSLVASVDYRMGPEHPYPAAIQDGTAALQWLATGPGKGCVLGVAGDSAGGTLSAVAALHARDLGIRLAAQLLIYPAVDQGGDYPSRARLAEGYLLTQADITWFTQQYFVGRSGPVLEPDASPLRADSHAGLAPALVLTCGFDPLVDEGKAYAEALTKAGVPVRAVCLEGAIHGCLGLAAYLACGRDALDEVCDTWASVVGN